MINNFKKNSTFLLFSILILSATSAKSQISVGTSSNTQIGWSLSKNSLTRQSRIYQKGTSGLNIRPSDKSNRFKIYGTSFKVSSPKDSFDYASTLKSDDIISDSKQESFSVYGVHSGTSTRTSSPSLGWFGSGNSSF